MEQDYFCISIPKELQQYTKAASNIDNSSQHEEDISINFGVKLIKDKLGNLTYAEYYSDLGELLKRIFYVGSSISSIEHYRNNNLYSNEKYESGKISKKILYDKLKNPVCIIDYEYNKKGLISVIRKSINNSQYEIEYGYDILTRVDSRIVKVDNKTITNQNYRYDILDRIVEYKDENQTINVLKVNQNNELMHYTIIDKIGNVITITNKYLCSEYIGTELDLNGHKMVVNDRCYIDNVMLKKPYTNEDDLDLVMSKMIKISKFESPNSCVPVARRKHNFDITSSIVTDSINGANIPLPISVRKLRLLQNV